MIYSLVLCAFTALAGCKDKGVSPTATPTDTTKHDTTHPDTTRHDTISTRAFVKGADIGWITEQEARGVKFYSRVDGAQKDIYVILKEQGINSIRLRVWVKPTDGYCNTADVLVKAQRAKAAGMRIMIDFHYSDWWADPGKQNKPADWASLDVEGLKTAVYNHTVDVMTALKNASINVEWAQVGNETNDGMLWPEGKASLHMANFAGLVQKGYEGIKAVSPTTKVIVHISNGYDNGLFRWMFDGLKVNGAQYDIIGMSLYPSITTTTWQATNAKCLTNMKDMVVRYGKPVMIVEVGMPANQAQACHDFIADLITKVRSVPDSMGQGVMYWEPQAYNNYKGYSLGAFENSGKPSVAMDAFKE